MINGKKILFLGLDAAMPDLVKKFVAEGVMPNTEKLMSQGIFSRLETVFPPLTAAAWTAIVSGAGSGTNGVPSLMVKHPGEELDHWHTSFDRNEVLCETLWDVAKKMGKKVALINWPVTFPMGMIREEDGCQLAGSLNPPFRYFFMPLWDVSSSACFSNKLLHCNQIPGRAVQLQTRPAEGWSNLPESKKPCLEFDITVPPTYVEGYPMHVLVYATTDEGYDRMLISESKNAAEANTDIGMGEYGPWITKNFMARDYQRNGRFRFQILELSKDGKDFKLYQSAINITIGFFTGSPLSYPYLFAENLGIFDALNIDVDFVCFTGGPAMMEAGNDWDICSLGLGGVSIGLSAYDYTLIDVNDYEENLAIFTRPDSAIANDPTNPEVWKGAECVYPTGTTAQAVLAAYLQSIGLTLADVTSTNADNANSLTVFSGGTGDVLGCWNAIALAAEDAGFIRVSDSGQLNIGMMCGSFAHPDFLAKNPELVATCVAVFHQAAEWAAENVEEAAVMYYDHCEEEGFLCTEDVALKTMQWYRGPSVDEFIAKFTGTGAYDEGAGRELLPVEEDILLGYDFFVSEGKYTVEQRNQWLQDGRVDNSVALAVAELLGK